MMGFFPALLFIGLLHLTPVPPEDDLAPFIHNMSGHFMAGGMVVMHLQDDVGLMVDGQRVPAHKRLALFGYGRDVPGETVMTFITAKGQTSISRTLRPRIYETEYIEGVAPHYVTPPPEVRQRIAREAQQKKEARGAVHYHSPHLADGFLLPVRGRVSGVYGSQRFFNGEPRRPHYGLDIAAPQGALVRATLRGQVTLAEQDMYYEGGLIFIDHGLGLVSAYLHLGEVRVEAGDIVERGDVIGTIGNQGRSTGAHLDWRLYWYNKRLDPELVISAEQKQGLTR